MSSLPIKNSNKKFEIVVCIANNIIIILWWVSGAYIGYVTTFGFIKNNKHNIEKK